MIGIEYRICCGLAGLAFMCNNPFLLVFLFPWGQGWISDVFPTCQVRVVRFYVSLLFFLLLFFFLVLLPRPPSSPVSRQPPCPVSAGNRDHRRSVYPAGPQPRPSVLSVPSRTSTATICTQCSLPDLDRDRSNFSHDRILSSLKRCTFHRLLTSSRLR